MTSSRRLLGSVLLAWLGIAGVCAGVTGELFAGGARRLLKVHFVSSFAHPLGEAVAIWLTNSQATAGTAGCIGLVLLAQRLAPAARGLERIPWWVCDLLLAATAARTAVLAGVLLGAYGTAQLRAFWPDGPVEVLAWAVLCSVYIQARRRRFGWRESASGLFVVELLLGIAALLEACL
jgi:hypothetical protein